MDNEPSKYVHTTSLVDISGTEVGTICLGDVLTVPGKYSQHISADGDHYITINDVNITDELILIGKEEIKNRSISFSNCNIARLRFIFGNFNHLNFTDCTIKGIELSVGIYNNLEFNNIHSEKSVIESLYIISGDKGIKGKIGFNGYDINKLRLGGVLSDGLNLHFNNILLKQLEFRDFVNKGILKFINITFQEESSFTKIYKSNLGTTEFYDVDFKSCASFEITNVHMVNCIFQNIKWPAPHSVTVALTDDWETNRTGEVSSKKTRELVEFFRQVKYAYSKQGDNILELEFHGYEMNEYYNLLTWKERFWTKVIIRLSYWTSNYGQSLLRPILFIVLINGILFNLLVYLQATNIQHVPVSQFNSTGFWNSVAEFLRFSNPLHKNEPEFTGIPFILDCLIRIVSSFSIYNIIRATRRFVK